MWESVRKIFKFAGKRQKMLAWAIAAGVIKSVFDALQIFALFAAVQSLVDGLTWQAIPNVLIILLIQVGGKYAFSAHCEFYCGLSGLIFSGDKRLELGEKLRYVPMGFFDSHNVGRIAASVTSDMFLVEMMGPFGISKLVNGLFHAVVLAAATLIFNYLIGLIVLGVIGLYLIFFMLMQRFARRQFPKMLDASSKLASGYLEYIRGIGVVRAYNNQSAANRQLENDIEISRKEHLKIEFGFWPFSLCLKTVLCLGSAAVMLVSALLYLNDSLILAGAVTMVAVSFLIFSELDVCAGIAPIIRGVSAAIDHLDEVFGMPKMDINGQKIAISDTGLQAQNVTFSYQTDKTIIQDVSMAIPPSSSTALVGPSGGGKTTLCKLLARFWDPDSGRILLSDHDLRDFEFDSFIANISIVFQNVYLFADTVENNIRFGRPDATREEVIRAAEKACAAEFIQKLENGYETLIGEGGCTLSGGEKQRISVARAMLKGAPIIIFDEATSGIDPENELQMIRAIKSLTEGKTVITIAHKLSTIQNADRIYVIDDGKIVQSGTHSELMGESGLYQRYVAVRQESAGWRLGKNSAKGENDGK